MLRYLLQGGTDWKTYVIQLLLSIPIVLFSLSLHETAHGFVAYKLGDPTARSLGRLTLDPLKHIDPFGFICMLLCGFGWAKPVPINSRYFKKPRRDMALASLAGPVSNLLLATLFAFFYWIANLIMALTARNIPFVLDFLYIGVSLNVTLAVFNLIPIPPLDGSRILCAFLPPKAAFWFIRNERIISIVLSVLLLLGVLSPIINFLSSIVTTILMAGTGLFYLFIQLLNL